MSIVSGLFMSVGGDRRYKADFFASYFASFIANGVFPNPSTGMQVIAGSGMSVNVKAGKAWINGYYMINDSDYNLQLDVADGVLKRIDRIVLRLDFLTRMIVPVVKKGTFATSPAAPSLQRDADAYEIALADVAVNNGAISISQANITDLRLNSALCGIVHGTVDQVDTTTIFNQYQSWFNNITSSVEGEIDAWQDVQQQEFDTWFQSIQGILDGDVAANLAERISSLEQGFAAHTADNVKHINAEERTKWDNHIIDPLPHEVFGYDSEMVTDSNGLLKELLEKTGGILRKKTTLKYDSSGVLDSVTVQSYSENGITIVKGYTDTMNYNSDGNIISVSRRII
jgi:hypothetical protein